MPKKAVIFILSLCWLTVMLQASFKKEDIKVFQLDNGLKIILYEDHKIPNISYYTFFRVGSRCERPGLTGVSHFIEHMMFNGTKKFGPGEFDRLMEFNGGANNAYTGDDFTAYTDWFPSTALEKMVELEADRMQDLLFDPQVLESERGVVASERRLSVENNNEAILYENVRATAIMAHPYHWDVIGWMSDILGWRPDDIKQYYQTYYAPNNAVLVVVGDFESSKLMELIKKYYGQIPAQAPPPPVITVEPPQQGRKEVVVRKEAQTPSFMVVYHGPACTNPDFFTLSILQKPLVEGESSRLYRRLVRQEQLALSVSGGIEEKIDPFLFMIEVKPRPGVDLTRIEKIIDEELAKIIQDGLTETEFEKARNIGLSSFYFGLQTNSGKANMLGAMEMLYGSYERLFTYIDSYLAVKREDIPSVARKYFNDLNKTTGYLLPEGRPEMSKFSTVLTIILLLIPAMLFSTERLPRPEKITLDNGLIVYYWQNPELPLVSFRLLIKGAGSAFEPDGLDGLANFTADMLLKGTSTMTAEEIAEALDFMGARLSFTSVEEYASGGGECLSQFLPRLLQIAADCLSSPAFNEDEYKKELSRKVDTLKAVKDNPGRALRQYFKKAYFGQHPFGHISIGTDSSLARMSLSELKKFHAQRYRPDTTMMAVVGDVKREDLIKLLNETLGRWSKPAGPAPAANIPPLPSPAAQKLVLVDKPDATQAYFALGSPGFAQKDKIAVPATIMNTLWGGRFTSWLSTELRIKRGLTYGASSSFQSWKNGGLFMASSYTRNEKIGEMLDITFELLKKARSQGFSAEEIESAKNYIIGQFPETLETNGSKASAYLRLVFYELGFDYFDHYLADIQGTRLEEVKKAAQKLLPEKNYTLVIVGKASDIKKQLQKFGRWEEKKITDPDF